MKRADKLIGPDLGAGANRYVSAAKTRAILAAGARFRAERAGADDMLSVGDAAMLACTDVATMRTWISQGRVIALKRPRNSYRLPRWQFEPALRYAIPQLGNALGTTDGWTMLAFLEAPAGMLAGRTPRLAIEQGDVELALKAALACSF